MPAPGSRSSVRMRHRLPLGAVLVVAGAAVTVAVLSLLPPGSEGRDGDASSFSAERALDHVEAISGRPHPMGSAANAAVREYIVEALRGLGLEPEFQTVTVPDYYSPAGGDRSIVNVISRIPGTAATSSVALMAHYDTVPTTPGANDNGSGVAALLETARAILEGPRPVNDVLLLFTDGEEPAPRFGSTALVAEHPSFRDIGLVINLEAIGTSGPSTLIELSGPRRWLVDEYASIDHSPAAFSFLTDLVGVIGGSNTDFAPFRDAGVWGFEFAYLHGSPIYHTADDTTDSVSSGSLQHHGSHTLALARHFGDIDLAAVRPTGESVFFSLFGSLVIRYPTGWALPAALLAVGWLAVAIAWRSRLGWAKPRGLTGGLGGVLAGAIFGSVVVGLVWYAIVAVRPSLGIWESYGYLVVLVGIAAGLFLATTQAISKRARTIDVQGGVVALWILLGLGMTIVLPGASYLFVWPALTAAAGLALLSRRQIDHRYAWTRFAATSVVSIVAILLVVPAVDVLFQFAQPRPGNPDSEIPGVVSISVLLAVLTVALVHAVWAAGDPRSWSETSRSRS